MAQLTPMSSCRTAGREGDSIVVMWLLEEFPGAVVNFVGAEIHAFARMSGMLDLSRDEKAKHFLPRWLREAPRTLERPTGLPSANLPSETQAFLRRIYVDEG